MKHPFKFVAAVTLAAMLAAPAIQAATYTKADKTNDLGQATSWGGTAPTSGDIANWSGTYSASTATNSLCAILPGSALSWQGITVGTVAGTALTTNTFASNLGPTNITAATEAVVNGFNMVTITTKASHGFEPGQTVIIAGVTPSGYNGTYVVAGVPTATTFNYTNATGSLAAGTAFGTVQSSIYVGGAGSATANSKLTIGTSGIDLTSANVSLVVNDVTNVFSGNQQWKVPAGRVLHFGNGAVTGASTRVDTSGSDGTIEISGGGVASLNEGGGTGFTDASSFAPFTGSWQVDSSTTLRALRNGATAFGSGSITLNGGTLAVGGMSGDTGNWTWNSTINLNTSTTSYLAEQNVTGTGRSLILSGSIGGSGNLVFVCPLAATNTFTSQDAGFILSGSDTMSGAVTIGGPVENGVPGRQTYVRVGGNATGTATTLGAGNFGSLGSATSVVDNGVLSFTLTGAYAMPCAVSGTGTLRIGSQSNASGTGGFIGDAYQVITLTGANTYSGPTIINAGTLALASGATLPNSSTISIWTNSINSSAVINTFDVSALTGGFTVSSGQTLSLNGGQITGTLTCGLGSTNIFAPAGSNNVGTLTITGNLNLSGGTNTFVLDINNSANDQVSVGGTLTATGVTKLQFVPPGGGLNAGTYTLFTAANPVSATSANFSVAGLVAGPRPQTFSIAVSGNLVQLVVTGNPGSLTWVGDGVNNYWNTATTSNWWNNLTFAKDVFYTNDNVTFDDTGSNTPAINLVAGENPSAITVNASQNYVFGGAGQLAGATSLTKSGTGKLTLLTSNSFTGGILVNGGTLAITNDNALGNVAAFNATNLILDGGTLLTTNSFVLGANTNRGITIGSVGTLAVTNASTLIVLSKISGGTLTKTGNGTLVLSNLNAHTLTVVNGGSVVCGSGKATGAASSWAAGATIQSGSLDINGQGNYTPSDGTNCYLFDTVVTFGQQTGATSLLQDSLAGHVGFTIYNGTSPYAGIVYDGSGDPGKATISANWYGTGTSSATTRQVQVGTSANAPVGLEFTGTISQRSSIDGQNTTLEKTGSGVLKISNTNYFPGLKISGGTLIAGHVNALGSVRAIANTVTVTGSGSTLDLNGFSPTVSDIEDGGTSDGTILNNGVSPATLTVTHGTVVSTFSGMLANGTGTLALTKAGVNTVTLSGTDTYTGNTVVSNGTLVVAAPGSLATGTATTVYSNATLNVSGGTVNGPVTINPYGTLGITSSGVVNGSATVSDAGKVTVSGAGTLANLNFTNTGSMNFNVANGGVLTVATSSGITNNGAVNSITINITGTAPAPGTYTLIAYSGSLNGSGYNAYKLGTTPGGASYTLVNNPGVAVELTVAPAMFWTGAQSDEWSTNLIGGLMNWTLLGSPVDYTNGAVVVFDDSLTGSTTVDVSVANITPANVYFNNSTANYTLQGSAAIAGSTLLGKNGTGTLTVINNNTYSGGTTINNGVLQVGTNGTSGSLGSGPVSIVTDLQFNRADNVTVANAISGGGTLQQNGSGTLTLSGVNTATGATTVNAGTLVVTNGNAIGDAAAVVVTNTAAFQINASETIGSLNVAVGATAYANLGTLTYSGGSILGNLTGSGNVTWKGTSDTVFGQFTTANALAFNGTLALRGGTPSTGPGAMEGAVGRYWLHSTNGSQQAGTAFALDTGSSATNGQDFIIGDWDATSGNRLLTLSSLTGYGTIRTDTGGAGVRNLVVNQSSGDTTFNGMLLSHLSGSSISRALAFVKTGTSSLTMNNIIGVETAASAGSAPLSVTVLNGTLVLNATNTYTDATTVSNGTLIVNGVIGGTSVTVAGGSLGGTGLIQSPVTVENNGTLFTSKTGLGTLTVSNTLTFSSGSTNFTKINATTSGSDVVQFSNAVYAGTLVVSNLSGTVANGQNFQIFSAGGTGSFASITPAPPGGLVWNFNAASGVLSAASGIASNPTNITVSVSSGTMSLSWPADHLGWILQEQANSLSDGLGTNWTDVPGSTGMTSTNLPVIPGNPSVFYRLRHP
jgi:fibronectin-binding autotransporter adhesin